MAKNNHILLGKFGEEIAQNYLQKNGYTLIEKNFKKGRGDIDIITRKANTLVFFEVKTRSSNSFGKGEEAITKRKKFLLKRSVEYYLLVKKPEYLEIRIDLIVVYSDSNFQNTKIKHYENITM